jgi:hypothetical protein
MTVISPKCLRPGTVVTVQMRGLFKLAHHFANACHGRPAQSHQLRGGLIMAALIGGAMLAAARA